MIILYKRLLNNVILSLSFLLAGFVINNLIPGTVDKSSLLILVISFFLLSCTVLGINYVGSKRNTETQTLFNFAAIGVKFVLAALIALLYFEAFKKSGLNNILLFFILYLTFTVYLMIVIVKSLNNKSIKQG